MCVDHRAANLGMLSGRASRGWNGRGQPQYRVPDGLASGTKVAPTNQLIKNRSGWRVGWVCSSLFQFEGTNHNDTYSDDSIA